MIRLIQRRLIIPRGDTGTFTVPVIATNSIGDVAVFSIMDEKTNSKVFEKIVQVSDTIMTIEFSHGDTVNLPVGKFVWDIKFYQNPQFIDGELVDGEEIDSYYAAFNLPVCEIRQTGDRMLMSNDAPAATLAPNEINYINASINEVNTAKQEVLANIEIANTSAITANASAVAANDSAVAANTSAIAAKNSASSAAASVTEMNELIKTIPTKVSELENDSGYLTQHQDISGKANISDLASVATSGSYTDLSNKPFIPTAISDLTDDSGHYTKPQTGIPASDLEETYLTSFTETDPTVPSWAKAPQKPTYTAQEVGALPADTIIPTVPTDVSAFNNDAGYLTQHQDISDKADKSEIPTLISELQNDSGYITGYTETDPTVPNWAKASEKPTYTAAEVGAPTVQEMTTAISTAIGNVHQFSVEVVQELPTTNIKEHTVYFVPKTGETNDIYDEYIRINNNWEMIGNTQIDLSNYATKNEIPTNVSALNNDAGYITTHQDISGKVNTTDLATVATSGSYTDLINKPTIPEVPVQDVQINGTSILNNGVANVPIATKYSGATPGQLGAISIGQGLNVNSAGSLTTDYASTTQIKNASSYYAVITPQNVDAGTFYGLAKAAGDSTQSSSSNSIGNYTPEAKAAIWNMLGLDGSAFVKSDWELIREDTVTNATEADIDITVDENGNAFELTDIRLMYWLPTQETSAAKGDYGKVLFYNENTLLHTAYNGAWTQASNATGKQAYCQIEQSDGMAFVTYSTNTGIGSSSSLAKSGYLPSLPFSTAMRLGSFIYDKISITKVTGTLQYALYGKRKRVALDSAIINVSGSTPSITALPGHRYICGEVLTLNITLPSSGIVDIVFTSGSTATVLSITAPSGVTLKWANGFNPSSLNTNTTYEINIMDGLGVAASWT